jgi:hypothetical protein
VDERAEVGGGFNVDDRQQQYRRQDAISKPRNAVAAIEREILQEIASQSGRYGERLNALLDELAMLRQTIEHTITNLRLDQVTDAEASPALRTGITQYNRLRAQAQQVQHYLIIHREAMGFWNHDDVFRCYPIPAAFTLLPSTHTPRPLEHP